MAENKMTGDADFALDAADMKMWTDAALAAGFDYAVVTETKYMSFDASLRRYCEENLCGNYGKNYGCPPDCGSADEMESRVRRYEKALVLQSMYTVTDFNDERQIKRTKSAHNEMSKKFIAMLESGGYKGCTMLAGPCTGCKTCLKAAGLPCSHPENITSCLSAYCVETAKLAEHCAIPYWCGEQRVAYFSVWLFNDDKKIRDVFVK